MFNILGKETLVLTVKVTPEVIRVAHREDPWACPIALATKEALRAEITGANIATVHVTGGYVYFEKRGLFGNVKKYRADQLDGYDNAAVWQFVRAFDSGQRVTPRTFTLKFTRTK